MNHFRHTPWIAALLACVAMLSGMTCGKRPKNEDAFDMRTGVNVSHWLSQSDLRGEEREKRITAADFALIRSMGFDHVRIPVDEEQMWDAAGNREPEAFRLLHSAIGWAMDAGLRVIVDLHILRSHHFNEEARRLWTDPAEQQKLIDLWVQLSGELGRYPNGMVAYEILNEAVADDPDDWNRLLNRVCAAIRQPEPERKIVIGSNMWQIPSTFPDLDVPENDSNIILSFHFYTPLALTHHRAPWTSIAEYSGPVQYPGLIVDTLYYDGLSASTVAFMKETANGYFNKERLEEEMMPAIRKARELGLPLFCGEFGVYPTIPEETRLRWYRDITDIFRKHDIAFCHWCYKGDFPVVDENNRPDSALVAVLTAR